MKIAFKKGYIAIYSQRLCNIAGYFNGVGKRAKAFAVFPFIGFRSPDFETPRIVNHERIHFRQEVELLFVGLYVLKFIEWFRARIMLGKNNMDTYTFSAFEQEAYLHQDEPDYLHKRKLYACFKYLKHKVDFEVIEGGTASIKMRG